MHELWVSIVIFVGGYIALYTLEFTWKLLFRAPIALDAERNEQNLQLLHRLDQYKHGPEWVKDLVLESKRSRGEIPEIQTTPATTPPPIAEAPAEVPIAATIRVKIPNGDVLIGNLKQSGSQITGSVHVRIRTPGFMKTATVLIRMDGQEATVSIPAFTTGRSRMWNHLH